MSRINAAQQQFHNEAEALKETLTTATQGAKERVANLQARAMEYVKRKTGALPRVPSHDGLPVVKP